MPAVGAGEELQTLAECQYTSPSQTLSDLLLVRSLFSDLRLFVDFYCFPNKEKKKLLYLAGTLPVHYEGSEYNIPVCIWLHETHPASRPRCYVCPSVSMVINPSCPCVDLHGNVILHGLNTWTQGVSNLSHLVSEMRQAFQKDTPLYARCPVQVPPPAGGQVSKSESRDVLLSSPHLSGHKGVQWEQSRQVRSYTEELLGIDFSALPPSFSSSNHNNPFISPSPPDQLSRTMGTLRLVGESDGSPVQIKQSEATRDEHLPGSGTAAGLRQDQGTKRLAAGADHLKMAANLPQDQAAMFLSLMTLEGRTFSPEDVIEAVQLNRDFSSAFKFLTHSCPICQDQVTFSKMLTMTHCSCFLCLTCFKSFFSAAIKEKNIDQLVCPQCGQPEVKGHGGIEESMEYFNLLDTQIRHFLPPSLHELFQRKLRDRALQEMPNFRWCAHCSFGMLHEAERLRMDCPSCKKSTCCQCRSPWSPQHQGLSCHQFRLLQQQNKSDPHAPPTLSSIECPCCLSVFSLSRGGCLHFTCSQCQHQFCGGCSQSFSPGGVCGFAADCGAKGLHAHHPRDCLYHLRDWSVHRLHLLLQYYRVSPSWLEGANHSSAPGQVGGASASCPVLELKDGGSLEEPCGRLADPEHRGLCQGHYKERLVELINRYRADPAMLFTAAEMMSELRRWCVAVPTRNPEEPEPVYTQRLRLVLTNSVPLRKQLRSRLKLSADLGPLAPPPHLLLSD